MSKTDKYYENKYFFVLTSLKPLCYDVDSKILDVFYNHEDGEEFVHIIYQDEDTNSNKKICVTGDSFLAMARDVINKL